MREQPCSKRCIPHYLGTLTLILETGVKEEFLTKFGEEFYPINDDEALVELHDLVNKLTSKKKWCLGKSWF
ncbi:MAG: hypothetical protein CM1200mP23_2350 [Nitrososphaerota archaeon]|nr:MAG: hypothetical protein CM1200mP23_2350 [Nitrososphaerota archaeon]